MKINTIYAIEEAFGVMSRASFFKLLDVLLFKG